VVLLIVLYRRSNPDTHIGAFFGNASQRRLQGGRTIPHVSTLSMFQKLFGTWALLVWFPMAVLAFVTAMVRGDEAAVAVAQRPIINVQIQSSLPTISSQVLP